MIQRVKMFCVIPRRYPRQSASKICTAAACCFVFILMLPLALYAGSLNDAKEAYLYGDYNGVIQICREIIDNKPNVEAFYFMSLSFFNLGAYGLAREHFRVILNDFKGTPFFASSLVKLVDTYFLENNLNKAEALYKSILQKYPSLKYKPLVYLRLAQISAKKGNWEQKNKYLKIVTEDFKGSTEDRIARRLTRLGDFFTIQVGAFSNKSNAVKFSHKLKEQYPVYIIEEKEEDLTLYKVRVGKFKKKYRAENTAYKLRKQGYPVRIYP